MVRRLLVIGVLSGILPAIAATAGTAAGIAASIRESSFDRDECYRIREVSFTREDLRLYFTQGYLIFSKPVAGRPFAAVFSADVEGGDGEVILFPPDRAERRSLALYTDSPNLDEHIRGALMLFTGDTYAQLKAQLAANPTNRKAPEIAPVLDDYWSPILRNIGASYQTRLTYDLMGGHPGASGLFAAMLTGAKLGNFDIVYEPSSLEQIFAGQLVARENRLYFDTWTSFAARSSRKNPVRPQSDLDLRDYRIDATVNPDLSMDVVARVKGIPAVDGLAVAAFDLAPEMKISEVKVDGRPAEVLANESLRYNLTRAGSMFLVVPPEPLRGSAEHEFEFRYSGKVIHDAGERVFYVSARGTWYPSSGLHFTTFDMRFRYPREFDLVSAGELMEEGADGDWKTSHRRTSAPVRMAAFNLGDYEHARLERGPYVVDVCANRRLERALQPRAPMIPPVIPTIPGSRRRPDPLTALSIESVPDPLERLKTLAGDVTSALEFMASKFGPPALPHLTVSPIPGTFGQGFPGLIYLSTLSYIKNTAGARNTAAASTEIFFQDMLHAHEVAHQWWGNRVTNATYRDNWLMEALANYSALLYLEKRRGPHSLEVMLDSYRENLLAKSETGQIVDSAGPIVLGTRLESSQEPRGWRAITYGKGSWIMQMLRRRMGDERFLSLLAEIPKRYDRKELSTEQFRLLAAEFLPPKSDDPKLETFFDCWVYGTGIPTLKLSYNVKGTAPNVKLTGTVTQSGVDDDFTVMVPVEIQVAKGHSVTRWVRASSSPATFTVALQAPPSKVALDPHQAVLRK
ncbi:MAG TPA: M1 family aminopeptidase [Bryobacteraceae bacterium]|nr:M1 family aminopeptidase [Bryobacteraceae bacterium]